MPGRPLPRPRPVHRPPLELVEQRLHPHAQRRSPPGRRRRAPTVIGSPTSSETGRPRVRSSGRPAVRIRCGPQIAIGSSGAPVSRARATAPGIRARTVYDVLTPASGKIPTASPSPQQRRGPAGRPPPARPGPRARAASPSSAAAATGLRPDVVTGQEPHVAAGCSGRRARPAGSPGSSRGCWPAPPGRRPGHVLVALDREPQAERPEHHAAQRRSPPGRRAPCTPFAATRAAGWAARPADSCTTAAGRRAVDGARASVKGLAAAAASRTAARRSRAADAPPSECG